MRQWWIYLIVFAGLAIPIILKLSVPSGRLHSAEKLFEVVESLPAEPGKIAIVAMDFTPNTVAENEAQTRVIVEHLFRRRIPVVLFSLLPLADTFLKGVPEEIIGRLAKESPTEKWEYGKDWVNLGFQYGSTLFLQSLGKTDDLPGLFGRDTFGSEVATMPIFKGIKNLRNVSFAAEFSGSMVIDSYIQFLQRAGYVPKLGFGPTSVITPEAYVYLDSGQLSGLLEGIPGAAWYSQLLQKKYPNRIKEETEITNTALGVAQLLILLLVVIANVKDFISYRRRTA